ncbi:MAG TPA: MauE/DoxX family redox-associated membrane protein [Propionibacteriaceae bacterium]|nr:MauE/DoxX family redox-associated membrane protein [Propionibacteriaceae bacterium]
MLAPLLLAGVLGMSGVAKLRDKASGAAAFAALGVPKLLAAPWIVTALPYAELGLALGLLLAPGLLFLAVALLVAGLCTAYWALIARAVRARAAVNCNCFGQLTSGSVGPWTLARNSLLLVVALVTLADSVRGLPAWYARVLALDAAQAWWLAGAIVSAALAALVFFEPQARASDLPTWEPTRDTSTADADDGEYVRRPIPPVSLMDAEGSWVPLPQLARQQAVLLVWVSFTCGSCAEVLSQFAGWAERLPQLGFRLVVPDFAELERSWPQLLTYGLIDPAGNAKAFFGETAVPLAVLLGADGLLAGGPVRGSSGITEMVEEIVTQFDAVPAQDASVADAELQDQGRVQG